MKHVGDIPRRVLYLTVKRAQCKPDELAFAVAKIDMPHSNAPL
jgi:hypothetical protein